MEGSPLFDPFSFPSVSKFVASIVISRRRSSCNIVPTSQQIQQKNKAN